MSLNNHSTASASADTDTPRSATAVGLLYEGVAQLEAGQLSRQSGAVGAVRGRMREWFQRNF